MKTTPITLLTAASLVSLSAASAADISDLRPAYGGSAHHNQNPAGEEVGIDFQLDAGQANGKFTGFIGSVYPITGKVTSTGKVTFSGGGASKGVTLKIKKGKAQLSATGEFLVGSLVLEVNPPSQGEPNGPYTFHVAAEGT